MPFKNEDGRIAHAGYYLPKVEIKDYNVKINGKNFFDQPINNDTKTYENIRKIATGQRDDHTACCLLDYPYFSKRNCLRIFTGNCKIIVKVLYNNLICINTKWFNKII